MFFPWNILIFDWGRNQIFFNNITYFGEESNMHAQVVDDYKIQFCFRKKIGSWNGKLPVPHAGNGEEIQCFCEAGREKIKTFWRIYTPGCACYFYFPFRPLPNCHKDVKVWKGKGSKLSNIVGVLHIKFCSFFIQTVHHFDINKIPLNGLLINSFSST